MDRKLVVVGSGMIAKVFSKYKMSESILVFASGVSNSQELSDKEYEKETFILRESLQKTHEVFVYFGTCSVMDQELISSRYVLHKTEMENIVKDFAKKYFIFRLPQVVGYSHNNTFINYIYKKIVLGEEFDLYSKATRNLIGSKELLEIASFLIDNNFFANKTINIASPRSYSVLEIVAELEKILNKRAHYILRNTGSSYNIDVSCLGSIMPLDTIFDANYLNRTLARYHEEVLQNK